VSADETIARRAWLAAARWARGRGASETAASSAFDMWWMSLQPAFQRVADDAPSWWYGRGSEIGPGPCLYDRQGRPAQNRALDTLPLDGGYAPRHESPEQHLQGQFKRSVVTSNGDVFTIIGWWDRPQGSTIASISSCFIVRGDHAYSSEALVTAFPLHFPGQAIQLAAAGVELVEVAREE
jgi:hypothetical protein